MHPVDFVFLLASVEPNIVKWETRFSKAIHAQEGLVLTLRFWPLGIHTPVYNTFLTFQSIQSAESSQNYIQL